MGSINFKQLDYFSGIAIYWYQGLKEGYSICVCLSLSGLCWAKKTGIFILGTLTKKTVDGYQQLLLLQYMYDMEVSNRKREHAEKNMENFYV